jgi:hypothetical protein
MSCSGQINGCGFRQELFPIPLNEEVWKVMLGQRVKLHFVTWESPHSSHPPETPDKDGSAQDPLRDS